MKNNDAYLYRFTRPIVSFLFKLLFRPQIKGQENILDNNCVLAGNHTSILDCLLLISSTKRSIHFLAKKELWDFPKGIIFSHMGLIPMVLVFPEGTTEKEGKILPFKIGAVKMAYETSSKIVPFIIKGEYKLFRKRITIEFLKPLTINKNLTDENDYLREIIKQRLEG